MKKSIARILITTAITISVIFVTHKIISSNNIYEVTYSTYKYSPETNDLSLYKSDCKFTIRAHSINNAKEKIKDMIYLNYICVSDKIIIQKVVEL